MDNLDWMNKLETLMVRFSHLGMSADIAAMDLMALWGLYRFLLRVSEG